MRFVVCEPLLLSRCCNLNLNAQVSRFSCHKSVSDFVLLHPHTHFLVSITVTFDAYATLADNVEV